MKKRIFAAALATALITSMVSTTALASEPLPWGVLGGEQTTEAFNMTVEPIINVILPGDLSFGIDPLYTTVTTPGDAPTYTETQIISGNYAILNFSNVKVQVNTKLKLEAIASTVNIVNALAAGNFDTNSGEFKSSGADKADVCVAVLLPNDACSFDGTGATIPTTALLQDGSQETDTVNGGILSGEDTVIDFLLDEANADGTLNTGGVSGFVFDGYVDPHKTYTPGDLKVTATFKLDFVTEKESTTAWVKGVGDTVKGNTTPTLDDTVVKPKS